MEVSTRGKSERPNNPKKIAFGAILSIAGVILLMFNLGVIPYEYQHLFFSWASLLLALGIIYICDRRKRTFGIVLLAVSALSYLHHFNYPQQFGDIILPVLLIALGVSIVVRRFTSPKVNCSKEYTKGKDSYSDEFAKNRYSDEFIDQTNVLSGSERRFVDVAFKGATISNIFGGS